MVSFLKKHSAFIDDMFELYDPDTTQSNCSDIVAVSKWLRRWASSIAMLRLFTFIFHSFKRRSKL